jgi:NAD(P)-dependent dehydrogenase (short-subunit alcohol dehydrogenase family)
MAVFYARRHSAVFVVDGSGGGSIILISSIVAVSTFHNLTAYGISKMRTTQLMKQLSVEWGRYGIRANAIAPGYMNHMMKCTADRYTGEDVDQWVMQLTPMPGAEIPRNCSAL